METDIELPLKTCSGCLFVRERILLQTKLLGATYSFYYSKYGQKQSYLLGAVYSLDNSKYRQ